MPQIVECIYPFSNPRHNSQLTVLYIRKRVQYCQAEIKAWGWATVHVATCKVELYNESSLVICAKVVTYMCV